VRGLARPLAIVGASAIVAVVAMATILPSTLSPMFRKPPGVDTDSIFRLLGFFLAAWVGVLVAYAMIYANDASPPNDVEPSRPRHHTWRIRLGLGLARAMVTFSVTAPLIGVLLTAGNPRMSRGLYASPWLDVALAIGLGGLLVGMLWMLETWRSFLEEL
jgi:hypothetical protein